MILVQHSAPPGDLFSHVTLQSMSHHPDTGTVYTPELALYPDAVSVATELKTRGDIVEDAMPTDDDLPTLKCARKFGIVAELIDNSPIVLSDELAKLC